MNLDFFNRDEKIATDAFRLAYPFKITEHFLSLIDKNNPNCPLRKQITPSLKELDRDKDSSDDPLNEQSHEVVKNLIHRYPDRVLVRATNTCFSNCRFCTRRREVGQPGIIENIDEVCNYIKSKTVIKDVLVSGGDPFTLPKDKLLNVLEKIRKINSVGILRIGTRSPVFFPQILDKDYANLLKSLAPLYINIHFNHWKEVSPETEEACNILADAGIVLGSQSVLLKDINDSPRVLSKLYRKLLTIRVRPYYLYQMDLVTGTSHFRTPVGYGPRITRCLRGFISGMAVPQYVIDAPGGGGKVALSWDYEIKRSSRKVIFKNHEGKTFEYP